MRQKTILKVEALFQRELHLSYVQYFSCSNREGARRAGVAKESFKRVVDLLVKRKVIEVIPGNGMAIHPKYKRGEIFWYANKIDLDLV